MKIYDVPTRADQEDFLIRLYFGAGDKYLRLCVNRAYLDFNRTLHGIAKLPHADAVRKEASEKVETLLENLLTGENKDQPGFDDWHRKACDSLCSIYKKHGYDEFHIGQAQKWLNMSFKYIRTMGEDRLRGYERFYQFGHVPLDSFIIKEFINIGKSPPCKPPPKRRPEGWSRIETYQEYMDYQQWIRQTFAGSFPLSVEFFLWQDHDPSS